MLLELTDIAAIQIRYQHEQHELRQDPSVKLAQSTLLELRVNVYFLFAMLAVAQWRSRHSLFLFARCIHDCDIEGGKYVEESSCNAATTYGTFCSIILGNKLLVHIMIADIPYLCM